MNTYLLLIYLLNKSHERAILTKCTRADRMICSSVCALRALNIYLPLVLISYKSEILSSHGCNHVTLTCVSAASVSLFTCRALPTV